MRFLEDIGCFDNSILCSLKLNMRFLEDIGCFHNSICCLHKVIATITTIVVSFLKIFP